MVCSRDGSLFVFFFVCRGGDLGIILRSMMFMVIIVVAHTTRDDMVAPATGAAYSLIASSHASVGCTSMFEEASHEPGVIAFLTPCNRYHANSSVASQ